MSNLSRKPQGASLIPILLLAAAVIGLWGFPHIWYRGSDRNQSYVWLKEATNVAGWKYKTLSVAESAENLLSADQLICGEFAQESGGARVMVFSAKRFSERSNDIGLFVHTPDRCWTQAGWKIESADPDHVEVEIHGVRMVFERRVFSAANGAQRELVYFGGLVGGQPLPYRLDHNLSVGQRYAIKKGAKQDGGTLRASDRLLWVRVWDSFVARRALLGPKQFIRISIPIGAGDPAQGDPVLVAMLGRWLASADYQAELAAWRDKKS